MNKSGLTDSNFIPAYWKWGTNAEKPRFLHTMFRVKNVEASLRFYCEGLGMKVMDRHDFEAGRFSLIYLGYDGYDGGGALELTYNWDSDGYTHGSGYGHISIGVPDIDAACTRLKGVGAEITVPPKHLAAGAPQIAFAIDPDGYAIELIQTRYQAQSESES